MEKIRVADYCADFIYKLGVKKIFMVTGGGAMFMNDGVAKHPDLEAVCNHHEQASAMAAVGYAKYTGGFASACFTTGCGSTNAITGLLDAWQDNVRCFFISGQVKKKETCRNSATTLRQFGVQEADIISVVSPLCKYAVMINKPESIVYHMEKAAYLSNTGRPGPVWIDIPLDIQGAFIDTSISRHFDPGEIDLDFSTEIDQNDYLKLEQLLNNSQRPVILAGNGIRLAKAVNTFKKFIKKVNIPVVTTYLGIDLLEDSNPLNIGRVGIKGDRAGNFTIQNSDLVISLGTRLSVPTTGFEYDLFARESKVVVVDIDPKEHKKNTVKIDQFINADLKHFFHHFNIDYVNNNTKWNEKCLHWKNKWPVCLKEYSQDHEGINLYYFVDFLSKRNKENAATVSDAGSSYYVTSQSLKISNNQRYITSGAQADMGFTLPAAIGVSVAKEDQEVIAITGDGSFQMNLQELQTLVHYKLPVKLFIWNNDGYLSIRSTQSKFFEGRYIGTDSRSGLSFPDIEKIAVAYGIYYLKASKSSELEKIIQRALNHKGPVLIEIISPPNQPIVPAASSKKLESGKMVSKPLEDMFPFLPREEFLEEMIVEPLKEE